MESAREEFQRAAAALWVIAAQKPGLPTDPADILNRQPYWFPILPDRDRSVTKRYGVYHALGLDAFRIARPAAFLIGRDRRITFIFVSSHQTERVNLHDLFTSR